MKEYGELVREAIRKAHEEEDAKAAAAIKEFEIGKTYATSSICDHDCIFSYTIMKRTEKTVTIRDIFGNVKRCKIHRDGRRPIEYIYPQGVYSMCPVLDAGDVVA